MNGLLALLVVAVVLPTGSPVLPTEVGVPPTLTEPPAPASLPSLPVVLEGPPCRVHQDQDISLCVIESGGDRRVLPEVSREADDLQP